MPGMIYFLFICIGVSAAIYAVLIIMTIIQNKHAEKIARRNVNKELEEQEQVQEKKSNERNY